MINLPINHFATLTALIVDDQPSMKSIIRKMLADLGFKDVYTSLDGREALEVLESKKIDIIISDWNMPIMNGLELLKEVRKQSVTTNIPFIMITGNIDQAQVLEAIDNGVSEYVLKPFKPIVLKDKIIKALRTQKSRNTKPVKRLQVSPTPNTSQIPTPVTEKQLHGNEQTRVEAAPLVNKVEEFPALKDRLNILIVDDEPDNITVLSELLKSQFNLRASLSAENAIEMCEGDAPPDLILLDIMMPGMNGLELCEHLKKQATTEHIPIIFISALSETKHVVKGLQIGAADYITKPIQPEITLARVNTQMQLIKRRNNMAAQLDLMMENMRLKEEIERILDHDLRNPLSVITASTEMLIHKGEYLEQEVKLISDSADLMKEMLDEKMLIQQLEGNPNRAKREVLNAFKVMNKVVYGQKLKSEQAKIFVKYHIESSINFIGDDSLCFNMFTNLLNNAIEASEENDVITIDVEGVEQRVIFKINNKGVIPKEIQPRFFEKYITHGKHKGTGLGTYSAKLAVESQKGEISFVSNENEGTTLVVSLPSVVKTEAH